MSIVSNVSVYGLDESIKASKYPMSVDISKLNDDITNTVNKLASCKTGEAHDNFLHGIVVQFDLNLTVKCWTEAERYHFFEIVSSQSTMHRITNFNLDKAYCEYVDSRIIDIMKEKVENYNDLTNSIIPQSVECCQNRQKELNKLYLEILYSNPCGFKLTARMTTNYSQLKTIYHQRKTHRLTEWIEFCEWIKTLPHSEWITGGIK